MFGMDDPNTSSSARVACEVYLETKYDRENRNRGYKVQVEGSYLEVGWGGRVQMARGLSQFRDQVHGQVSMEEAPKKTQE